MAAEGGNDNVDVFDAFGLRDGDGDGDDGFDAFTAFSSNDAFAATPLPPPTAAAPPAADDAATTANATTEPTPLATSSQPAITQTDSQDSDPFGFDDDPFHALEDNDGEAARGFKKSPPSSPTPTTNTDAVAAATAAPSAPAATATTLTEAATDDENAFPVDFDIGPPSSTPFTAEEAAASSSMDVSVVSTSFTASSAAAAAAASAAAKRAALPPRLGITLFQHEEVISQAAGADQSSDVACSVTIEGQIHALVQSSDALENCPFQLIVRDALTPSNAAQVAINKSVTDENYKVTIPKSAVGNVPVASYRFSSEIENMPVLVQSKVRVKEGGIVHVDVQVRSNLNNEGNLANFAIAVPCPTFIDGGSILVTKGEGAFDELKRVVKWKRADLTRGESFLVGFQANLAEGVDNESESKATRTVPILLRCMSKEEKISTVEIDATAVSGHPAAVHKVKKSSFRLLHRVQS